MDIRIDAYIGLDMPYGPARRTVTDMRHERGQRDLQAVVGRDEDFGAMLRKPGGPTRGAVGVQKPGAGERHAEQQFRLMGRLRERSDAPGLRRITYWDF